VAHRFYSQDAGTLCRFLGGARRETATGMSRRNNGMSKVSEVYPSNFISAGDLDGRDVTLTIAKCADKNTVKREDGKLIDKPILYFKETPRGFVAGKTNARLVRLMHGNEMGKWIGKTVTLYPTTIEMSKAAADQAGCMILSVKGKMATVPCIRVRVTAELAPVSGGGDDDKEDVGW
jgi:hypothetical protein